MIVAGIANDLFASLVASTTITRLLSIQKSKSIDRFTLYAIGK
jgi:hypothetical protein